MELPTIIVLQLQEQLLTSWSEMYTPFINKLQAKSNVQMISTMEEAGNALQSTPPPAAVWVTDKALAEPEFRQLKDLAVVYVRNGGTIVFGARFSGGGSSAALFSDFSLPWRVDDYYRGTFHLNAAMTSVRKTGLAPSYSQKAHHLTNVQHEDALHLPSHSSRPPPRVFFDPSVDWLRHTPVALGSFGEGKVGYMGDINAEIDSENVLLALLGLND
ncbi:hypothetical protein CKM354_000162900 [Cercospora kikuchii]|uniref:Uncharacterized protein n=1 Tax=Cercospora kikuchii TaxID=84275 RepID=A0A9P3F8G4_9PEZI|nr:uncharacterized protein CKM354_000162900 [Cercospora kikuchii]GIZ38206.1 hypothetical protein CKM354_000162900 [Cercospora kikuchii]